MNKHQPTEYQYHSAQLAWENAYLWNAVEKILLSNKMSKKGQASRLFDVGCGNGASANAASQLEFDVVGVDPSNSGIEAAIEAFPHIQFSVGSAYDDLASQYGTFPLVMSLEVVEHCFEPRKYARTIYDLLDEDGMAIISTPYHGYLKNLAIALLGKCDDHWTALWDGGHIKFWSQTTLEQLLKESGFSSVEFVRVGRIPVLAKSMIAIARK